MKNNYLEKYRQDNLRKAQMKMLYILKEVVAVCDRHKIPYWLDGGTLLGAARHGGFIPWDDDVDISMRKEDLERFLKIAPFELPEDLMVQTLETDEGLHNRAYKVRDLNSFFVDGDDDNRAPYQKGMFVDIFPFVNYPSRFHRLTKRLTRSLAVMNFRLHAPHYYSLRSVGELIYFGWKRSLYLLIWQFLQLWCKKGDYMCSYPYYNWYGTIYRTADLFPLGEIDFEGCTFKAPGHPDEYLQSIYGDWRKLPPPEKRVVHSLFFVPNLIEPEELLSESKSADK